MDPQKDVTGALDAIEGRIATRSETISDRGGDFEDVATELAREEKLLDKLGLKPRAARRATKAATRSSSGSRGSTEAAGGLKSSPRF